jgi:hypothetical protein
MYINAIGKVTTMDVNFEFWDLATSSPVEDGETVETPVSAVGGLMWKKFGLYC